VALYKSKLFTIRDKLHGAERNKMEASNVQRAANMNNLQSKCEVVGDWGGEIIKTNVCIRRISYETLERGMGRQEVLTMIF
jgi:hypothetical protein